MRDEIGDTFVHMEFEPEAPELRVGAAFRDGFDRFVFEASQCVVEIEWIWVGRV